jgi:hypothetical protein
MRYKWKKWKYFTFEVYDGGDSSYIIHSMLLVANHSPSEVGSPGVDAAANSLTPNTSQLVGGGERTTATTFHIGSSLLLFSGQTKKENVAFSWPCIN